jgi:hypothetical protein
MISSILFLGIAFISRASAACSRAMLIDATTSYIQAQASGLSTMTALSSNYSYKENNITVDIKKSLLSQPITIDFNRTLHDTVACSTFTELSAATNAHPYVIATRMLFTNDKITAVDSVIADSGDWAFNATGQLYWTRTESWSSIPEAQRDTRAVIQAAGDAYLDSWGNGSVPVPYGTPCARLEGGSYTDTRNTKANTCKMPEFPKPFYAGNRRYVIDEEVGGVAVFNDFPFIDKVKPEGTPSVNFVRVEKGGIRYIHETTVCSTRNCGR